MDVLKTLKRAMIQFKASFVSSQAFAKTEFQKTEQYDPRDAYPVLTEVVDETFPSTISEFYDTVPAESAPKRDFVHLVGAFDRAKIEIDGKQIDVSTLERTKTGNSISDYFTVKSGNTTFVLWDKPDAGQRDIQKGRKNHFEVADNATVKIGEGSFSVETPSLQEQFAKSRQALEATLIQRRAERAARVYAPRAEANVYEMT